MQFSRSRGLLKCKLVGVAAPKHDELNSMLEYKESLVELLGKRRVLVIADDVWRAEQIVPVAGAVNMGSSQVLPVRFQAACAIAKVIENEDSQNFIKSY